MNIAESCHFKIEMDKFGIVQTADDDFFLFTGYNKNEIVNKHHCIFIADLDKKEEMEKYETFWNNIKKEKCENTECHIVCKNGFDFFLSCKCFVLKNKEGKVEKIVQIFH